MHHGNMSLSCWKSCRKPTLYQKNDIFKKPFLKAPYTKFPTQLEELPIYQCSARWFLSEYTDNCSCNCMDLVVPPMDGLTYHVYCNICSVINLYPMQAYPNNTFYFELETKKSEGKFLILFKSSRLLLTSNER